MPRPSALSAKASGQNGPGATGGAWSSDLTSKLSPSGANCTVFFSGPSRSIIPAMPSRKGHRHVSWPELVTGLRGDLVKGPAGWSAMATPCARIMFSPPRFRPGEPL